MYVASPKFLIWQIETKTNNSIKYYKCCKSLYFSKQKKNVMNFHMTYACCFVT